jgi:hypothetical protein
MSEGNIMITWEEFSSAVFRYREIADYDQSYEEIMNNKGFIKSLRTSPGLQEMQKIIEFLNRWRCRIKSGTESEKSLLSVILEDLSLLSFLRNYNIKYVNFDEAVHENNFILKIEDLITLIYIKFRGVDFKFGSTATAKILHILVPELFVMWDNAIFNYYRGVDERVSDSGPGYVYFLILMKKLAVSVNNNYQSAEIDHSVKSKGPASYLSMIIDCKPPKTLAKFLDEYNWVTITNNA